MDVWGIASGLASPEAMMGVLTDRVTEGKMVPDAMLHWVYIVANGS